EYAGRRTLLESVPFFTGYGVEIGLLIDTITSCGLDVIAQVDLGERIHTNQPLDALSRMAFEIIQVAHRRSAAQDLPACDRYTQFLRSAGGRLEPIERTIKITERPPLRDLLGYARDGV
ncbi:MAG: glucosyl-3-phosphoglycerate synthase, partial [Pseudonocardiaceae bacterium]